jgi:hypothetical protein
MEEHTTKADHLYAATRAGIGQDSLLLNRGLPSNEELAKAKLDGVCSVFSTNWVRLFQFSNAPHEIFKSGSRYQLLVTKILREFELTEMPDTKDHRFHMIFQRINLAVSKIDTSTVPELAYQAPQHSAFMIPICFADSDEWMNAFCSSLVIQAWTTFETLAEDLWVAAVNARPSRLASLKGSSRSKYRINKDNKPQAEKVPKSIPFAALQQRHFNVGAVMGELLLEVSRVSFRSLGNIREAYHLAFSEQSQSIDFQLDREELQYIAAIRNVLIHKAGKVDTEFFEQTKLIPNMEALNEGDTFPLSGVLTKNLVDSVVDISYALIKSVYAWLIGHPEQ